MLSDTYTMLHKHPSKRFGGNPKARRSGVRIVEDDKLGFEEDVSVNRHPDAGVELQATEAGATCGGSVVEVGSGDDGVVRANAEGKRGEGR